MKSELDGRVAVITGASQGLGCAIAAAYVEAGAGVVLGSRNKAGIDEVINTLKRNGGRAIGTSVDVGDPEQIQDLLELALTEFGQLDIWVNNAATSSPYGGTLEVSQESFIRTLQTNIYGTYFGSITAARHFVEHRGGKLINVVGAGARQPEPFQNAYASSKAWIRNFTLALADELKGTGVEVFVFNPGLMPTELVTSPSVIEGYENRVRQLETVLSLISQPPEVPAQKAVWLASAATDGRTGIEVRTTSRWRITMAFLAEAVRRLFGRSSPPTELTIHSVPPSWVSKTNSRGATA